ncbi:hypothetical protein RDWZM_007838 [Blomia tropicalis]|uniref:Uncharacterized protein n=1 Tax=Blomia tropicalis TaxID=40697 RepID=A0A9Q0RJH3_BLOTA|nr:hypothetical protein RDWZM_007838 [Blomia tropicalis]
MASKNSIESNVESKCKKPCSTEMLTAYTSLSSRSSSNSSSSVQSKPNLKPETLKIDQLEILSSKAGKSIETQWKSAIEGRKSVSQLALQFSNQIGNDMSDCRLKNLAKVLDQMEIKPLSETDNVNEEQIPLKPKSIDTCEVDCGTVTYKSVTSKRFGDLPTIAIENQENEKILKKEKEINQWELDSIDSLVEVVITPVPSNVAERKDSHSLDEKNFDCGGVSGKTLQDDAETLTNEVNEQQSTVASCSPLSPLPSHTDGFYSTQTFDNVLQHAQNSPDSMTEQQFDNTNFGIILFCILFLIIFL